MLVPVNNKIIGIVVFVVFDAQIRKIFSIDILSMLPSVQGWQGGLEQLCRRNEQSGSM